MIEQDDIFLHKAQESLAGAESEFVNDRYNNAANRAYYAVFQAAIHALLDVACSRREWPRSGAMTSCKPASSAT
ncbi:MAG TPA: hypothetical protein VFU81_12115 [Thermomicrobiales bacterium]|nr:hypothetical protein [Thermomicrobiales bacterium]